MDSTQPSTALDMKPVTVTASSSLVKAGPVGDQLVNNSHVTNIVHANTGPMISVKVNIIDLKISKTLQFFPYTIVFDALKMIRDKVPEINSMNHENYGIFIPNSDSTKGTWLENNRSFEYYMLKSGDQIDFANKFRKLNLRLLDGETRSLLVDDSQIVGQLMIFICSQIGIANYEEYSLINDIPLVEKEKTLTLRRQNDKTLNRDYKKMEELKKKLHTEDDIAWLDHSKTLRQQNIDTESILILKRKFFFSDKNIDTRDPIQLNLLYVQCRDAILNGTHPINEEEAIKFAAIQCKVRNASNNEVLTKSGCLEKCADRLMSRNAANKDLISKPIDYCLKECLPKEYVKVKGIEKKILQENKTNLTGLSELEAKLKYTQLCRSLKTYGVTFFLVKEKMKGKNKLVARLLGITKESILRVDEKTKEFLNVYPLECVKKWAASPNTFTLDFGDHYKEPYYSMQTTEGEHIARLISGYIDIILKKKKAKEFTGVDMDEESEMIEELVSPSKATLIQMNKTNANQCVTGNVVLPGILRNGQIEGNGQADCSFSTGTFKQNTILSRQAHLGHTGTLVNPSKTNIESFAEHHRPLITTIRGARSAIQKSQSNLNERPIIEDIGNDPASIQWKTNMIDVNRQNVTSHLSAMNAATAQVVTLTSNGSQNTDYNAVGAAVSCISTNLVDFSKDIAMISSLQATDNEWQGDAYGNEPPRLMDAAKKLCFAFSDFLRYVEPECNEPRQNLFSAVSKIGEAGNEVVKNLNEEDNEASPQQPRLQDTFISLAKTVASSTAGLVIASKNVANHCGHQQGVNEVISMVTQCALNTSQLVSCTKVCASTIGSRECQEQVIEAARQVSRQVDAVYEIASHHCQSDAALAELNNNARNVSDSVIQLLNSVKASNEEMINMSSSHHSQQLQAQDESIEKIFNATDNLFNCMGDDDSSEMIRQAKILAQATTQLVNSLKIEAHAQQTSDQQRKLLLAAKLLAEATSKMVEAAKSYATYPNNPDSQNGLKKAAEELKNATKVAAGDNLQLRLIKRLELCAKQAASCATQSIAAIQVCTLYNGHSNTNSPIINEQNKNNQAHSQLIQQCKQVADNVPKIVQGIRGCMVSPFAKSAHISLVNSCEDFLMPSQKMILATKALLPTIVDEIKAIQLRNCTNQLANAIYELKTCLAQMNEVCGSFEAEAMIDSIQLLDKELLELKNAILNGINVKPLPGENLELCEAQLSASSKTVGLAMAQMLTAAVQGNETYTGVASKDTANSLRQFTHSIRAIVACSSNNPEYQEKLIHSARVVLQQSCNLVNESKQALLRPNESSQNQQRLAQIARLIAQSLYDCVNCLPGQNEIDEVIKRIADVSAVLFNEQEQQQQQQNSSSINENYKQIQNDLNNSALILNKTTNQIVTECHCMNPDKLSQSAYQFSIDYANFLRNAFIVSAADSNYNRRQSAINSLRDVYTNSHKLLHLAKSVISESTATSSRQQLTIAMKEVTESINNVVNLCIAEPSSDPVQMAQIECDNALRGIVTTLTIIHVDKQDGFLVINEPLLNENGNNNTLNSYYDCLEQIIEKSKLLGESMTGIANSCKNPSNPSNFTHFINVTANSICGLVETAAHSAYLAAISDVESKRGIPQILDTANFINCSQNIQQTCQTLESIIASKSCNRSPDEKKQHLIQAATQIAHSTASLCSASQQASARTTNILAKRHFVQSAKQVANATANFVKSIKSVDLTDLNNSDSPQLVGPLLEAVESLCQYALSPEFSSVPAVISENGARSQIPILSATKTMLDASQQLIQASKMLIANNKDPHLWQSFSTNSKIISDSIKRLATAIKEKAPAKSECDQALTIIDKCMKHLESAIVAIRMNQVLPLSELANSKSLQAYQEHAITCATQMIELIDQLRAAAKGEPEKLGHVVTELGQYFEPLVVNVIGCAAKTPFNNKLQTTYLEQTKTILESVTQFLQVSKEGASNPKSMQSLHQAIDENADSTKEVLEDLVQSLEETSAQNGYVATMVDSLTKTIAQIDFKSNVESSQGEQHLNTPSFVDLQTRIVQLAKAIQQTVKDMSLCDVRELGNYAQQLTQLFNSLIVASRGSIQRCGSPSLASRIKTTTQDLGKVSIDLINLAGQLQNNSSDKTLRNDLTEQIEIVNHRLLKLLESFQNSAKGTQSCISADNLVQGIIADLNTVIMFATAGTLRSDTDSDSFSNHREAVLRTAKTLVEDTKALVSTTGSAGPIDQNTLALGVQTSVKTITKLSDAVKLGAASLGSEQPDAQVLLINAVKDVASSLTDLIGAIKIVSNLNENEINENGGGEKDGGILRESAKKMVTNVQSLLKTVKTVEDEAARGTRALESAIEAIYQEVKLYSNYIASDKQSLSFADDTEQQIIEQINTKPDDLIKATKQITLAASKAIGAGNSLRQEDVITAANMGRKAVSDLLYVCRGNFSNDPKSTNKDHDNDYQRQVLSVGLNCSLLYKELLECIQQIFQENSNSDAKKQALVDMSKNISNSVSDILQIAEILKGTDWCDPEDPTIIAENELLGAANAIESAARKLSALQPRTKTTQNANENLNFDEQILEAAKSITNAAGVLIKAATSAQTELISQGKIQPVNSNEEDGQWSHGLISAARLVAAACHTLCEAANGLVQGHATEDRLISSAKQVASSTAALLVACKVKAELTSQAMKRLQHAGNAIKRASDALVRAAQQAVEVNEEDEYLELNTKFVGSIAQEIMLREEILRKERELKAAQAAYNAVKKARYHRDESSPNSVASSCTNSSSNNSSSSPPSIINEKK